MIDWFRPVNYLNMRISRQARWWIYKIGIVILCCYAYPLLAQDGKVVINNLDQLCAGFTENSIAKAEIVTNTPFHLPNRAGLIFDWYAQHVNAQKRWNTPLATRSIPVPWEGKYNIWVVVKYVNKTTLAPFNSFKTKVITIDVESCPEENGLQKEGGSGSSN